MTKANQIEVKYKNNSTQVLQSSELSHELSQKIFQRTGEIVQVTVSVII
jgi:hypothetical protein